jgi:hypothetical protein
MSIDQYRPAVAERRCLLAAASWLSAALATWALFVRWQMFLGTLGLTAASGPAPTATVIGPPGSGRATRSIAHVLYQTERVGRP